MNCLTHTHTHTYTHTHTQTFFFVPHPQGKRGGIRKPLIGEREPLALWYRRKTLGLSFDNHLTVKPRSWTRWNENKTPVTVGTRVSSWQISISGSVRVSRTKNRLERNRNIVLRLQNTLLRMTCQSTLIFANFPTGTTNKCRRRRSIGSVTRDSMWFGMSR